MYFLLRVLVNAAALWVAAYFIDGIHLAEGETDLGPRLLTIGLVALIFGLVNAIVRPIAMIMSLPLLVVTLGLFTFVVNALMLALTSWLAGLFTLDFHVTDFFWDAMLGALIITVVSWVLSVVVPTERG